MRLTGESTTKRISISRGGLALSGTGNCFVKYKHIATGGPLFVSGNATFNTVNFKFYPATGSIVLGGVAHTNFEALGFSTVEFSSTQEASITPVYPANGDDGVPKIGRDTANISTSCTPAPLPLRLLMSHNLDNADILKQFLSKNGFSLSRTIHLTYNKVDGAWRFHQQWSDDKESWYLVVEVSCVDTIAGSPVD